MVDKITEASLLNDFYGQLLTEKQQQIMAFYHEENLSLAEIAEELGISRQAVHDALKKAERALAIYEQKLGLVEKFVNTNSAIAQIDKSIDEIIKINNENKELTKKLEDIKTIINELED